MYGLKFLLELEKEEITYDYLVKKLDVSSKGTIGNWISRKRVPKEKHVNTLAKELDVEPYYINKQLTKEEQEWLACRRAYRRLKPKYEEISIEYFDEETQILHEKFIVFDEMSESKHEKEILWSDMENERLKHRIIQFINKFNSADEEHSARCVLYQIMDSVEANEDKVRLISNLVEAMDKVLNEKEELLEVIDGDNILVKQFVTKLAEEIVNGMVVSEW